MYDLTVKYCPGKNMKAADALSRFPVLSNSDQKEAAIASTGEAARDTAAELELSMQSSIATSMSSLKGLEAVTFERVQSEAASDEECAQFCSLIIN